MQPIYLGLISRAVRTVKYYYRVVFPFCPTVCLPIILSVTRLLSSSGFHLPRRRGRLGALVLWCAPCIDTGWYIQVADRR
jgi:hypothetical protein